MAQPPNLASAPACRMSHPHPPPPPPTTTRIDCTSRRLRHRRRRRRRHRRRHRRRRQQRRRRHHHSRRRCPNVGTCGGARVRAAGVAAPRCLPIPRQVCHLLVRACVRACVPPGACLINACLPAEETRSHIWHRLLITANCVGCGGNNFVKGVKWSPDGSFLLSNSEDHTLRLWTLRSDVTAAGAWAYGGQQQNTGTEVDAGAEQQMLKLAKRYPEAESVYDFCWYPGARRAEPSSCCVSHASHQRSMPACHTVSSPKKTCRHRSLALLPVDAVSLCGGVAAMVGGPRYSAAPETLRCICGTPVFHMAPTMMTVMMMVMATRSRLRERALPVACAPATALTTTWTRSRRRWLAASAPTGRASTVGSSGRCACSTPVRHRAAHSTRFSRAAPCD
jgi:hypothetical protein